MLHGTPGREAIALSIIKKIQEIHGGQETPRNGDIVLPKDAHVAPFSLEGLLNSILSGWVPSGPARANGLLGGHANLDSGHPSML
jgi:hypothetical protein